MSGGARRGAEAGLDDHELVRRIRAGDRSAFAGLVRKHGGGLLRFRLRVFAGNTECEKMTALSRGRPSRTPLEANIARTDPPPLHRAPTDERALTHAQARAFYDRFVWLQDWQRWYESPALEVLVREGAFGEAHSIFELGCGTGRLGERLLARELPGDAEYLGIDLSARMVERTRRLLARFGGRASVRMTDGSLRLPLASCAFDRFITAYVLDLLSVSDVDLALDEAHRVLVPGGRLCVASLGEGTTPSSRMLCRAWKALHRASPFLVGGCRPIELRAMLLPSRWEILHAETVVAYSVPTQVVVARRA